MPMPLATVDPGLLRLAPRHESKQGSRGREVGKHNAQKSELSPQLFNFSVSCLMAPKELLG